VWGVRGHARSVRQVVVQDGKVLLRTFALLPAWQPAAVPATAVHVTEAVQGTARASSSFSSGTIAASHA
jgi:hypothetical protein